ncbi:MAG: DUF4102 domain-containing protein [Betaproteobacteria bacterium]|nr:DUF4102 domain-containing protein [Betaproteobacteria bacterium]
MLTAKQIEALAPRERSYRVADSRGLSLRVDPSGAKYWIATVARKTRSLGRWPDISAVDVAR